MTNSVRTKGGFDWPEQADSTLACAQIPVLGAWSRKKFVGRDNVTFDESGFIDRLMTNIVETLDPYKLLLTQNEVKRFHQDGAAAWKRVLQAKDCSYFAQWIQGTYRRARIRLESSLDSLPPINAKIAKERKANIPTIKKPKSFVENSQALSTRLRKLGKQMLSHAYPKLIEAYGNSKQAFALDSIRRLYPKKQSHPVDLLAKAMLKTMDPYSTYFSDEEFQGFYNDLSGGVSGGIGVHIRAVPSGYLVEEVLEDSPAGQSEQINAGDIITEAEGSSLANLPMEDVRKILQGEADTPIRLSISRRSESKQSTYAITLTRKRITYDDGKVTYDLKKARNSDKQIAVIKLPSFYGRGGLNSAEEEQSCSEDLQKTLKELQALNPAPEAVVLDLRGNPGGYLDEAVETAGLFVGDQPVVGIVTNQRHRVLRDALQKVVYRGPLVVLVDEESASASEVLTGALKDYQRAIIIGSGSKTYGKGSVQRMYHLDNELLSLSWDGDVPFEGIAKVTTSVFFSPKGHSPNDGGVKTDIALFPNSKSDDPAPKTRYGVKIKPFIEKTNSSKSNKLQWDHSVELLKKASRSRRKELKQWAKGDSLDAQAQEKLVLEEAIEIADDYAHLAKKTRTAFEAAKKPGS